MDIISGIDESYFDNNSYEVLNSTLNIFEGSFCILELNEEKLFAIKFISDGFCRMVGGEKKQLLERYGETVFAGLYPDDRERVKEIYYENAKDKARFSDVFRINFARNNFKLISIKANVQKRGCKYYYYISYNDITDLKLLGKEAMYNVAIKNTNIIMWMYDITKDIFFNMSSEKNDLKDMMQKGYSYAVAKGYIMPESIADYINLHKLLGQGEKPPTVIIHYNKQKGLFTSMCG